MITTNRPKSGICLYEFQAPLFVECFIEEAHYNGEKGIVDYDNIFLINDIDDLFERHFMPLLISREMKQKIKIGNFILKKYPNSKRIITRFQDGEIKRGISGVKIKSIIPSGMEILEIFENLKAQKQKEKKEIAKIKSEKIRKKALEYWLKKRGGKPLEKKTKPEKPLTPYDIVGPCPGEDPSFSAFDYLRKKPIIGWDSPEKQEWFRKIMRDISKR